MSELQSFSFSVVCLFRRWLNNYGLMKTDVFILLKTGRLALPSKYFSLCECDSINGLSDGIGQMQFGRFVIFYSKRKYWTISETVISFFQWMAHPRQTGPHHIFEPRILPYCGNGILQSREMIWIFKSFWKCFRFGPHFTYAPSHFDAAIVCLLCMNRLFGFLFIIALKTFMKIYEHCRNCRPKRFVSKLKG